MKKYLVGYFCLINLIYSCQTKPKINNDLVYSALNGILLQDSIFAMIVCSKFEQVLIPRAIEKEFFPNEGSFIRSQQKRAENISIDTGRLYFYWPRKHQLAKSFIDTTCSKGILYRLSYPIFSRNLQTVVIEITEDCNCMLGGWGVKAVYKRYGDKWVKVKEFDRWIS